MKPLVKLYVERAINELKLSKIIFALSANPSLQEQLGVKKSETYFSATITHAYYCVFYVAKAYLLANEIIVKAPEEHKKVYDEFARLTRSGKIDFALLQLYESLLIKADVLLEILRAEKKKRATFTYKKIPQANKDPAKVSMQNAELFFKHVNRLCE